jgi:hypothetical protein
MAEMATTVRARRAENYLLKGYNAAFWRLCRSLTVCIADIRSARKQRLESLTDDSLARDVESAIQYMHRYQLMLRREVQDWMLLPLEFGGVSDRSDRAATGETQQQSYSWLLSAEQTPGSLLSILVVLGSFVVLYLRTN